MNLSSILLSLSLTLTIAMSTAPIMAASVDELLDSVEETLPSEDQKTARSLARVEALEALHAGGDLGLDIPGRAHFDIALAAARLAVGRSLDAETLLRGVLGNPALPLEIREKAGQTLIGAARAGWRESATVAGLVAPVISAAGLHGRVLALALAWDCEMALTQIDNQVFAARQTGEDAPAVDKDLEKSILDRLDQALELVKGLTMDDRTPLYALRVDAMDRLGLSPAAVQAWLQEHQSDPAAALVLESALSEAERLVGGPAPVLQGPRADGVVGVADLAALRGSPVLVAFIATWSEQSPAAVSALVMAQENYPELSIIAVSLDRPETLPRLPGWLTNLKATFPVIADGLGWDSERDDAWRVDAIPAIMLVNAQGNIAARDLLGRDALSSKRFIDKAMAGLAGASATNAVVPAPAFVP